MSRALEIIKSSITDMLSNMGKIEYALSIRQKKNHSENLTKYFSPSDEYSYEGVSIVQSNGSAWLIDSDADRYFSKPFTLGGKTAVAVRSEFFNFILNNRDSAISKSYQPQSLPPNRALPKAGLNPNEKYLIYLLWVSL